MSKMKELDLIAQGVADHIKEIIEDSVDWQLADQPLDGDDYMEMREYVINVALNKLLQKYGNTKVVLDIGGDSIKNPDLLNNLPNLFVFGLPSSPENDKPYIQFLKQSRKDRAEKMGQSNLEAGIKDDDIQQSINSVREFYRGKQNINPFTENGQRKTTEELVDEINTKLT